MRIINTLCFVFKMIDVFNILILIETFLASITFWYSKYKRR